MEELDNENLQSLPVFHDQPIKLRKQTNFSSQSFIENISLSSKSKIFLILRIIIFVLLCIFLPMHTIVYLKLQAAELKTSSISIPNIISEKTRTGGFYKFSHYISMLLGGKDCIIIYISMVYMLFHPFIALKLVFVTNFVYFGIIILQCLYQGHRPYWDIQETKNKICEINYANPSGNYFLITFFLLYLLVCFRLVNDKKKLFYLIKLLILIGYIVIIFISALILLIYQQHFIYQLMFSLILSLVVICIFIDIDKTIHNFILKSLKNVFKTRKYKMKIFFYVLTVNVIAGVSYFFMHKDNLNSVEDILNDNPNCSSRNLDHLGILQTFQSLAYSFGIVGAFWGASLTIEKECGIWWYSSSVNLILKVLLTLIINLIFIFIGNFLPKATYEFNFVLESVKYFLHYYIIMGILPWFFNYLQMNQSFPRDEDEMLSQEKRNIHLFSKTIFNKKFTQNMNDFMSSSKPLLKDNEKDEFGISSDEQDIEEKKDKVGSKYKKSMLIQDVEEYPKESGFDFMINKDEVQTKEKESERDQGNNYYGNKENFFKFESD